MQLLKMPILLATARQRTVDDRRSPRFLVTSGYIILGAGNCQPCSNNANLSDGHATGFETRPANRSSGIQHAWKRENQTAQQKRSTEGEHELHTVHRKCTTLANTKRGPFNGNTPNRRNIQTVALKIRRKYRPSSGNVFNESSPARSTKLQAFMGKCA